MFKKILGIDTQFFRSPGLTQGKVIQEALIEANMANIFTNTNLEDWKSPRLPAKEIFSNFKKTLKPGQIILLHDGGARRPTVDAVPYMIEHALNKGYRVVNLATMLKFGRHIS